MKLFQKTKKNHSFMNKSLSKFVWAKFRVIFFYPTEIVFFWNKRRETLLLLCNLKNGR